jgi:plasmid stabilization system protein ParE
MMLVRFHLEAEQELAEYEAWYRQHSEVAAHGFRLELNKAIAAVAEAPERWPVARRGERRYVFSRYPFTLFYRVHEDHVFIVAVAHQSRRPGYWRYRG